MRSRRAPADEPRTSLIERLRGVLPELIVALVAFLLVVADLDPTGTYRCLPGGPGLTIDESLNVQQGVRLEVGLRYWALGVFDLREVFGPSENLGSYMSDYPPLGRWLLGVSHNVVTSVARPADWNSPFVYAAGRFASAIAFAVTVFLVAGYSRRQYGLPAGLTAAASMILMPRLFGHAHVASLETLIGLFFTATVLAIAGCWRPTEPISTRSALLCGILFGLALLTKIQAILLPIPIALWALWHWRAKAIVPLAVFGVTGGVVFFLGWPWLWFDPVTRSLDYFAQTTDRISLPVWYMGRVFADNAVPWHYPFVLFAVTVPVGLHVLGMIGSVVERRDPACQLVLASLLFPLLLFAVPGVAVYDGARLFLVSFPLWAVLIGRGGGVVWSWIEAKRSSRIAAVVLTLFLAAQTHGIVAFRPTYLSYYNLLVGGLAGAERLGFEPTYWGDSITSELLESAAQAVPEGGTLAVSPVLHQFQLDDLRTQSRTLNKRNIRLVEYGRPDAANADALLVFFRRASLPEELRVRLSEATPIASVERQGVRLAGVYDE